MKKQVFKTGLSFMAIMLVAGLTLSAYGQKADKQLSKDYNISKGFTLGIDNAYGDINLVNWDKDELSVVVTIEVEASSQAKAEKLLESINIEIDESSNSVYFETEFEKQNYNEKKKFRVVYEVKTPAYLNVELEQAYGSVFIQELTGTAELEIKYSNLSADVLMVDDNDSWNSLELKYGDATIGKVNGLEAEVKYSGLKVSEAEVIDLESAYSKINLGEVVELDAESKYDQVRIDALIGALDIEAAYTHVKIGTVAKSFTGIYADMTYGNLKGGLESGTGFEVDAEASYGNISLPGGDYEKGKDGNSVYAEGPVNGGGSAAVEVSLKYGSLVLE